MSLGFYIWGIRLLTLLSFGALALVVWLVDPESSGLVGKFLFYGSVTFFLIGIFNLLLLRLRKRKINAENVFSQLKLSFRQGVLLALFSVGLLVMQSFRVLIWWDGLLLMFGVFIIELYFVSRD